jgi:hypothetical protein
MDNNLIDICENYIPRKDRERRGKREKVGRVVMSGSYHKYDNDSIEYFRMYKNFTRSITSSIRGVTDAWYSDNTQTYRTINNIPDIAQGSVSFSGGGYTCAFHIGIIKYCFENPNLFQNTIYLGASGGAGIATICLAHQNNPDRMNILDHIVIDLLDMYDNSYGMSEQVSIYTDVLMRYVTEDIFEQNIKGSDRLRISLTDVTDYMPINCIESKFESLKILESVIRASACIPILLDDQIRKVGERSYIDGGLTNNLPIVDDLTIRISCMNYPGIQADIYPSNYLDPITCFKHPGKDPILCMIDHGYESFKRYIEPHILKVNNDKIDREIHEIEREFINS